MIRIFDVFFASLGLILLFPLLILLWVIAWFDNRSPLFKQQRVGRNQAPFILVKFRTMRLNTASVATHLADPSAVTRWGLFLRRSKLDELPQLWNVLRGEMSLVGPRPCLFNQGDLIAERAERAVFNVRPGITGLSQIQGIDMSTPRLLAETDAYMLQHFGTAAYFMYILKTIISVGCGGRIRQKRC